MATVIQLGRDGGKCVLKFFQQKNLKTSTSVLRK